tara:strand:+ start:1171 stop:3102 length:1932 start_codon:yes stop_codon:yes gene_type:complete
MKGKLSALLLAVLMATMSMTGSTTADDSGRQTETLDVDCSGYTFEDLFEYNNAIFMFEILDDWATSDLYANSWVNESRASVVRENLDSLFEGVPGGNNSWISTDERDAVRSIGAKCIADMYTRIGIREGVPHRDGVSWNNATFVEDGIGLEEIDLIPEGHPDERDCQGADPFNYQSEDCREVPVSATNNLEISMFVREGETHNTRFNKLPNSGQSDFTVAMNVTNVTSATMMFTFPFVDGLRLSNWTIQDDGTENLEPGSVEEIFLPDGSVRISVTMTYDKADYPMIRNIFFDMTTTPPETNDNPEWTSNEPADNTIIPMIKDGSEVIAISSETMSDWATDDDAWGLDCQFSEAGWSSRMNSEGELLVTSGSSQSSDATCFLIDPYGAMSNASHTWKFGQPVSFSAPDQTGNNMMFYTDSVNIESSPTLLVQNLAVELSASQNGALGLPTNINLGSTASTDSLSLSGISPGEFNIHAMVTSAGMLDWSAEFDLGLRKANTLPIITVDTDPIEGTQATWSSDGYSFTLSGTAIDPDGGEVTLSAVMCGDTTTEFSTTGDAWIVSLSTAKCIADGLTQFDVVLSATDSVGAVSTVDVSVPDPNSDDEVDSGSTDTSSEDSGGLPSLGMFATLVAMLGAALLLRRD